MSRYARQIAVLGFGASGQENLRTAHVLVIGAGGLAAPVLQYLVGAGVGRIRLVDNDMISLSNLHRQTLFRERDIGQSKVQVAAREMMALNDEVRIEPVETRFDPANAQQLCQDVDLVLDCADSFAASYVASDVCLAADLPLISASVVGSEGYVGGFCHKAPGLRALFPDLPARLGSCDADGVLGPTVGVIGSLQAQIAVAVLSGDLTPMGRLVTYDATSMRFGGFRFDGAPDPAPEPDFIAQEMLRAGDLVIDLRAADETGPELAGARRLSVDEIDPRDPLLQNNRRLILACRSGLRAWQAAMRISTKNGPEIKLLALGDNN